MDKMAAVPGVSSVALASTVTMTGQGWHDPLYARDRTYSESQIPPIRLFKIVSPGYMKTLGTPLVAGRDFTWTDVYELRPVAMVSENLARELWGQPSAAIGKWVRPYAKGAWREVVGVVSDMRDDGLNQKAPTVAYWPMMMEDFVPGDPDGKTFVQRGACLPRAQQPDRLDRLRQRAGAGGLVGQSQPAAGERPHRCRRSTTRRWRGPRSRW